MTPTYSFSEIKSLVKSLDKTSGDILQELIDDEKDCYTPFELRAFNRFFLLLDKNVVVEGLRMEYLLSYN
jgi:hypothetical protein